MDYDRREVFPSSPLALVVAEVRFNDSPRLRQQTTVDDIAIALEPLLPVQEQFQQMGFGTASTQMQGRTFKNASSTAVATLTSDRLSLETTEYVHFAEFREWVLTCCQALVEAGVRPALQRIGLRYIDEIRVPDDTVTDAREWKRWVDPRLVDQFGLGPGDATVLQAEGIVVYRLGDSRGLNFRFAALSQGAVVSPVTLVRRPFDDSKPAFVLDFDGYRDFDAPDATLLSVEVVAEGLDSVHDPAGAVFQSSITDAARELFRRSEE